MGSEGNGKNSVFSSLTRVHVTAYTEGDVRRSHHPARGDAGRHGGRALGGVLVELVGDDEVDGQVDLDAVLLRLGHQVLDDLGALLVVERRADLTEVIQSVRSCFVKDEGPPSVQGGDFMVQQQSSVRCELAQLGWLGEVSGRIGWDFIDNIQFENFIFELNWLRPHQMLNFNFNYRKLRAG